MTVLDLEALMRKTIAPEANHLLTERPNRPEAPGDFGWFCREHAIITKAVLQVLGHPVDIVRGHISVIYPAKWILTTAATSGDEHFWCSSSAFPLLDLSLNLQYFLRPEIRPSIILRDGQNGPFTVIVSADQSVHHQDYKTPTIAYSPVETMRSVSLPAEAARISLAISKHISECVHGKARSLRWCDQRSALRRVMEHYE